MRPGLDVDYRQTNERKLFSIPLATFQVYLEPNVLYVISKVLIGRGEKIFDQTYVMHNLPNSKISVGG